MEFDIRLNKKEKAQPKKTGIDRAQIKNYLKTFVAAATDMLSIS